MRTNLRRHKGLPRIHMVHVEDPHSGETTSSIWMPWVGAWSGWWGDKIGDQLGVSIRVSIGERVVWSKSEQTRLARFVLLDLDI